MAKRLLTGLVLLGAIPALIYGGLTLAFRGGMIDLGTLFGTLVGPNRSPGWLIWALGAAAVLEVILAVLVLLKGRIGGAITALFIGVISLAMAAGPVQMFQTAATVPPIHDITTDTANPPVFEATAKFRTEGLNPPEYDTEQTAQQLEGYPDIVPIKVEANADKAFAASLEAAKAIGLDIALKDKSRGLIEGTATTRWFGFKDDVVIRITPGETSGSIIDIRSKSRIGRSDIGANADRIRELRRLILEELGETDE